MCHPRGGISEFAKQTYKNMKCYFDNCERQAKEDMFFCSEEHKVAYGEKYYPSNKKDKFLRAQERIQEIIVEKRMSRKGIVS